MGVLMNFPLLASFAAIIFAQVVKVPIQFIVSKKLDWTLVTSTGGMPSSHSAAVTALSTGVALEQGLDSPCLQSPRFSPSLRCLTLPV